MIMKMTRVLFVWSSCDELSMLSYLFVEFNEMNFLSCHLDVLLKDNNDFSFLLHFAVTSMSWYGSVTLILFCSSGSREICRS